jgi:hypothetical protein
VVKFLLEQGATAPVNFKYNSLLNDPEVQAKREFILKFKESGFATRPERGDLVKTAAEMTIRGKDDGSRRLKSSKTIPT